MIATTAFNLISQLKAPINIIQGGTSAGKTYSIMSFFVLMALSRKTNGVISIVSESFPHLRRGAMRDFFRILRENNLYQENNHSKSENTYKIEDACFEFFSADRSDKLRGGRRDYLFVNEANNITKSAFDELDIRTKYRTYLDFNPVARFWGHELSEDESTETQFIKLNYTHNEALPIEIVKKIESRKSNVNWWRVYGLGEIGELEGLVFNSDDYTTIESIPNEAKYIGSGIDFGFTNDPSVVLDLYEYIGSILVDERVYQTRLTNSELANICKQKQGVYVCDSSDPRTINELNIKGIQAIPCKKGADSINAGIDKIKDTKPAITKTSTDLLKEFRNYMYMKVGDSFINKPVDGYNHGIDALRYGLDLVVKNERESGIWIT